MARPQRSLASFQTAVKSQTGCGESSLSKGRSVNREEHGRCPVCDKTFAWWSIESHVQQCLERTAERGTPPPDTAEQEKTAFPSKRRAEETQEVSGGAAEPVESPAKRVPYGSTTSPKVSSAAPRVPLAERLRPRSFNEYVGQQEALGEAKCLRRMVETQDIPSLLLWGPPGCGKVGHRDSHSRSYQST